MAKKEVVEVLKKIKWDAEYDEYDALTEAIRCVELVQELVEALEEAREFFIDDGNDCNYWEDEIKKYGELIKKAKGG